GFFLLQLILPTDRRSAARRHLLLTARRSLRLAGHDHVAGLLTRETRAEPSSLDDRGAVAHAVYRGIVRAFDFRSVVGVEVAGDDRVRRHRRSLDRADGVADDPVAFAAHVLFAAGHMAFLLLAHKIVGLLIDALPHDL